MKKRIIYIMISLCMIIASTSLRISRYYSISCEIYAEQGIKGTISLEINNTLAEFTLESKLNYDEIVKINYLSNGRIGSILVDAFKINFIANQMTNRIYNCIERAENTFGIPIGNTLGIDFFSSIGPKIKFTVLPVGAVVYEIKSELISAGINQTLHRISIRFDTLIKCIAPFHNSTCSIASSIVIAETVIIGNVPEVILSPS